MFWKKPSSQSISISESQVSGLVGQSGGDLIQTQNSLQSSETQSFTKQNVTQSLGELEELLRTDLFMPFQEKALQYLGVAKEELQNKEPDKKFLAESLKRIASVLKEANAAMGSSQGIWEKAQPILNKLTPWLGVAGNFFI